MKYTTFYLILSLLVCPVGINAQPYQGTSQSTQAPINQLGGFDIDQMQQDLVDNNVMATLDTRPPLPPRIMHILKVVGLPILNAFVAVRKAVRNTWTKVTAAFGRFFGRKTTRNAHTIA